VIKVNRDFEKNTFCEWIFRKLTVIIMTGGGDSMATGIGARIMQRRKELGLTQEELAIRMGYKTKSAINKIELGINDVSQTKIVKFAEALSTNVSYLMDWEEVQKNNDALADIVVRLRTDSDFLKLVKTLDELDADQLAVVQQMALALLK
jgi:transcriptional regulator with XRE-family HTH domain